MSAAGVGSAEGAWSTTEFDLSTVERNLLLERLARHLAQPRAGGSAWRALLAEAEDVLGARARMFAADAWQDPTRDVARMTSRAAASARIERLSGGDLLVVDGTVAPDTEDLHSLEKAVDRRDPHTDARVGSARSASAHADTCPVPADGPRSVSSDGSCPVPHDDPDPVSADGSRPVPADGPRPVPADGSRPVPADGPRPVPADGPRSASSDGAMPRDGSRPASLGGRHRFVAPRPALLDGEASLTAGDTRLIEAASVTWRTASDGTRSWSAAFPAHALPMHRPLTPVLIADDGSFWNADATLELPPYSPRDSFLYDVVDRILVIRRRRHWTVRGALSLARRARRR